MGFTVASLGGPGVPGLLLAVILIVGIVVAVLRGVSSPDAKTLRGRFRELAWNLAPVIVSLLLASASGRYLGRPWVQLLIPMAAVVIVIVRPRWVRRVVAAGLIALVHGDYRSALCM